MQGSQDCRRRPVSTRWSASLLVYALFGTSRHLSVGATSATSALLASSALLAVGAATADAVDPATYQAYASAFVLVTGLVFLGAGLAKLGFITQFLSKPVMDGFVLGLAVFVAVGQLNKVFGVHKPEGNTVEKLIGIVRSTPRVELGDGGGGRLWRWGYSSCSPSGTGGSRPGWWSSSPRSRSARL